jgi:hypothetical protein
MTMPVLDERISVIRGDDVEVDLDTCTVTGVEGISGMVVVPAKRGSNLVVPGLHGELHIPAKKYGAANVVLPLWVRGVRPDGTIPGGSDMGARLGFLENLRTLIGLFTVDERITLRHTLSDGTAREIVGEVTDVIEPEVSGRDRYSLGKFAVALNCASPFWADLDPVSEVVTAGGPQTLGAFAGADAVMEDLLIEFGPSSNPRLQQESSGWFVQVNRVIPSGQQITVDTAEWRVFGTSLVSSGLYEDLIYGGRGTSRWFALKPEPGGAAPVVEFISTSGSGSVTVTGKRKFRIG